jgi:periplasmic protein TonB
LSNDTLIDDEFEFTGYDLREPVGVSFVGSLGLHAAIIAALVLTIWLHNRAHGNNWGQDMAAGAIQASLVSAAPSIPLPSPQTPTDNVLASDTPSPAPAVPEKKAAPAPDTKAIPIATKVAEKPKPLPDKPQQQEQKHPQQPPQQNRANYGEQAPSNMPRSMASSQSSNNPVSVGEGDFGSRFGWYVSVINRKVRENWYIQEVDPSTPPGRQAVVAFSISRDGTPSNFQIVRSSGVQSLDTSAIRAAQRVDSFGPLPPGYNGSTVSVAYTFTYEQPGH